MATANSTYPSGPENPGRLKGWLERITNFGSGRNGQADLLQETGQILGDNFESPNH